MFIKALPCALNNPCKNGATCADDNVGGYTCTCVNGYIGTNCQYGMFKKYSFKIYFELFLFR